MWRWRVALEAHLWCDRRQPPGPATVEIAKPAVAVTHGMNGAVFLPEQRQRHTRALELAVDRRPVRLRLNKAAGAADRVEQPRFQLGFRHLRRKRPRERGPFNPLQILTGRALPDAEARRDLTGRQSAGVKPQRFSDLPHRQTLHAPLCPYRSRGCDNGSTGWALLHKSSGMPRVAPGCQSGGMSKPTAPPSRTTNWRSCRAIQAPSVRARWRGPP